MTTKKCPFCAEEINIDAIKCRHCGEMLNSQTSSKEVYPQVRKWSPGVAALLSLIIPGAGQIYKGNVVFGLMWLVVVPIGYFFIIIPGIILHLICIITASSGNPYK